MLTDRTSKRQGWRPLATLALIWAGVICLAATGCNSGKATLSGPDAPRIGPHNAPAYPLGEKGFAEVLIEPANGGTSSKGPQQLVLAVYLLQPDLKTAMTATNLEVSASIKTPENAEPVAVTLTSKPAKDGPGASARYASGVGSYGFDEIEGELKLTLEGQAFTRTFHLR